MNASLCCDLCGGDLCPGTTSLQLWQGEHLILVRDVPAEVCQQCGQSNVTAEILAQIDQFLQHYQEFQPQRYLQVPEFSAAEVLPHAS